jgi:hypothetical protein
MSDGGTGSLRFLGLSESAPMRRMIRRIVNYSVIKDNWFVISGTNAKGFEFYHKLFVGEDDGRWYIDFDFTYLNSERDKYDPICSRIAHSFVPNLPGEHDH